MKCILVHIFLFFTLASFAQQDSLVVQYDKSSAIELKKFDKEQIEKYKADDDFNYEQVKQQEGYLTKIWNWFKRVLQSFLEWVFGVEAASGILLTILKVIPYLVLGLVLYFLIRFFLKVDTNSRKAITAKKGNITLSEEGEIIKNEDINKLIEQAIKDENYRLAIRYYYLLILQKLTKKELIDWQQEKTNEDYINEITNTVLKDKFTKGTLLYDFVWYGNFNIKQAEFIEAQAEFNDLKNSIK